MKTNNVTIKQALDKMVADLKLKPRLDESRIRQAWAEVMGAPIAKYTTSVSLVKGVLYIAVSSSALQSELYYSREKIKEVVNKHLQEEVVKEVVVR